MFPHGFCFAGRVAAWRALDAGGTAVIAWTRVHAIIHQTRAKKEGLRDEDRTTYLAPRGNPRTSRSASNRRAIDLHQTAAAIWSKSIEIGLYRDAVEELRDRAAIAARSSRDRGAIEPRSRRDRAAIARLLPRNRIYMIWRGSTET